MAKFNFGLLLLVVATISCVSGLSLEAKEKRQRAFSLFNVVTFDNAECSSTSTIAGTATGNAFRNGTCFTEKECSDLGGTGQGSCASGFGVCCLFFLTSSATTASFTVSQNNTYLRSENFPNAVTTLTAATTYTIPRIANNICQVRLDFESFNIAEPTVNTELNGGDCGTENLIITSSIRTGNLIEICGNNAGQHVYVDVGRVSGATATLTFNLDATQPNIQRSWEVRASQIPCGANFAPPAGCLQYHTGFTGQFQTFNFAGNNGHLASHEYSICIRQEAGFCCAEYSLCSGAAADFSLDENNGNTMSAQDITCGTADYVGIEGSSSECVSAPGAVLNNRYCGTIFNALALQTVDSTICDCTAPFVVDIVTDAAADPGLVAGTVSKGACLSYRQIPC